MQVTVHMHARDYVMSVRNCAAFVIFHKQEASERAERELTPCIYSYNYNYYTLYNNFTFIAVVTPKQSLCVDEDLL